jgi:hypothetical protein
MSTYYFDTQDGVPVRDRTGKDLASTGAAIEHSKQIASAMRNRSEPVNKDLSVIVLDESGREVHREPVYPAGTNQ